MEWLGWGLNRDVMLGDILERFSQGKSSIWLCKETSSAIAIGACSAISSMERGTMKRFVMWTVIVAGTFSLGFLTARSPLVVQEEMPSPVDPDIAILAKIQDRRHGQVMGTADFFLSQLKSAQTDHAKTPNPQTKAHVDLLRQKLDAVFYSMYGKNSLVGRLQGQAARIDFLKEKIAERERQRREATRR
jgi:hypothetical protein